jgi:hypothetical protein
LPARRCTVTIPQPPPDIELPNPGDPGVPTVPDEVPPEEPPQEIPPGREPDPWIPGSNEPPIRMPGENPDVETEL